MRAGDITSAQVTLRLVEGGYEILAGGHPVGSMRLERDGAMATITELCVFEGRRGYGMGSDAARALVRWLGADDSIALIRAWAPPDGGLAVYFWFRMGFRPVHGEGPEGGLWLERVSGGGASV